MAVVALAARVALPPAGPGGMMPPRPAPDQVAQEVDTRAVAGAQDPTTDDSGATTDPDDGSTTDPDDASTTDPDDGSTTDPDEGSTTTVGAAGTRTPPPEDRSPIAELLEDDWPWLLVLLAVVLALALGTRRALRRDRVRDAEAQIEARRDDGEVTLRETGHPTIRVVARLDPAEGDTTIQEARR